MRILKSNSILKMVNSYVIDSPTPSNISYLWNFGSLLGFCLVIQIATGVMLGMHYTPNVLEAFDSIEHIMRDVNNGWLLRYLHSNTASAFFFIVYLHIGRGIYYGSYKAPRTLVWVIGTIIFILMMATAFLGYVHSPKWFKLSLIANLFLNEIHFHNIIISLCGLSLSMYASSELYNNIDDYIIVHNSVKSK
jgi:quinol-cytochrome oxidoreductase complex cytochrome b subunit